MSYRESGAKYFDASLVNDSFPRASKIELMGREFVVAPDDNETNCARGIGRSAFLA